jgi:antitoxin component of RelBE/YafQ-DinJ toxin-antitoxin module
MLATQGVSVRMDKELKERAELLFSDLGMNMSTAIKCRGVLARSSGKCVYEYLSKGSA